MKIYIRLFVAVMASLCLGSTSSAQEVTAQIRGTVVDATGAGIPGAEVKATNVLTQIARTATSGPSGSFEFLNLPVGRYDVTVTKAGFRSFTSRNINLELNQVYNVPVTLEVGQVSESVQVEAHPVQVETTNTQLDTVVQSQQILDIPLNGRNWTQLQQLAPGVVSSSDRFGTYATNGSQSQQNSFLINGADAIDLPLNTPTVIPSPDAIGEFNLVTSSINPEYGRNSGGILNAIIKSGTNQFHGDAFEFYRDTFLDGRNFFQNTSPVFHQNQFGGTIGGPIFKNHTFFFASYQGTRARSPQAGGQVTVFTQDQRNGYFPSLATSTATSPIPLLGESGATYAAGTAYKTLFPTGHIPAADLNPIAQKLLSYVPLPNFGSNLYTFNPITTRVQDQGIMRVDHTMAHDTIWFTGFWENTPTTDTLPFTGSTLPGFGDTNQRFYTLMTASWTHTLSPTTINEVRASYLRFNYQAVIPQSPVLPSTLGFNINPQNAAAAGIPYVSVTGLFALGFSTNGPQPRIDSTYELTDNFSKVVGTHTLKFGYDGKRYQVNNPFYGRNNGSFTFGGTGPNSTGNAGADFLLGLPDSYSQGSGGYIDARTYEHYFYAQDSWKVRSNITLNYGTGYQIDTPLVNQHFDKLAKNCFRPGEQSTVFPTAPVGLVFPGDPGCSSSGYYTHYLHFGPRFGFAYTPKLGWLSGQNGDKLSIRGGFGIYFNRSEEELALQDLGAVPFALNSNGIGDIGGNPSFANPWVDVKTGQTIANKFPFTPATKGSTIDFSKFYPLSINVINPNFTSPYAMNYNLNIQRELPGSMILQVGYVGSQGRHLELTYEGNPITQAGAAACLASASCIANRNNQSVLYPTHTEFAPGNVFASVGTQATVGVSSYNSLQVSLNKRFSHGLQFRASYTWSHAIDDASGYENSYGRPLDPYNFALNRGDSAFDARHRFVISYDYQIPGIERFWNNWLTRTVIDGWGLSGITTLQTGFPLALTDSAHRSLICSANWAYYGCPDFPDYVGSGGVQTYDARNSIISNTVTSTTALPAQPYYWYNPNVFVHSAYGVIGNEGRNNFHGPGINNTDLNLYKRFRFKEQRAIELRLESYNLFNHTQFAAPGTNINSTLFARTTSAAAARTIQLGAKIYF